MSPIFFGMTGDLRILHGILWIILGHTIGSAGYAPQLRRSNISFIGWCWHLESVESVGCNCYGWKTYKYQHFVYIDILYKKKNRLVTIGSFRIQIIWSQLPKHSHLTPSPGTSFQCNKAIFCRVYALQQTPCRFHLISMPSKWNKTLQLNDVKSNQLQVISHNSSVFLFFLFSRNLYTVRVWKVAHLTLEI